MDYLIGCGIVLFSAFVVYCFVKIFSLFSTSTPSPINVNMGQVDAMDGISFESYVAQLLRNNGYDHVKVTKASGDFGVDVLGEKENNLWAFQCKCYSSSIGVHAVQEIYSGAQKYGADIAVVITNSHFTAAAKEMAEDLSVLLWDREKLSDLISKNKQIQSSPTPNIPTIHSSHKNIESRGESKMIDSPVMLQKNQLPNGKYLIGRDIPVGTYDFTWVFGSGSIMKFKNDHDTTLGATTYFQHMGNKYDYEYTQCLSVHCEEGEMLHIDGNIIVQISRSQTVHIEL